MNFLLTEIFCLPTFQTFSMAALNHLVMKSFKTVRRSDVTKIVNDGNIFLSF